MRFPTAVLSGWVRRALLRRLARASFPSGLFYPVCLAFAGGFFAAADTSSEVPGFALGSIWLYRAEVGLAVMGAIYIAGLILWLAWHGRGFFELGAFGVTLKASEAGDVDVAGADLTGIGKQITTFHNEEIDALGGLDARISALEQRIDDGER